MSEQSRFKLPPPIDETSEGTIKISTLLIVILSIMSLISGLFIYYMQKQKINYAEQAEIYYRMTEAIENDVAGILLMDQYILQVAETFRSEFHRINYQIGDLKALNGTSINVTQEEINELALEAANVLWQSIYFVKQSWAYIWSNYSGAGRSNNYTMNGEEWYLIWDFYKAGIFTIQPEVETMLTDIGITPIEILWIDIVNWIDELYDDLTFVWIIGESAYQISYNYEIDLMGQSYSDVVNTATVSSKNANVFEQAYSIMTTALILFTVAAVIVGFVMSLKERKFIQVAIIVGLGVSIIAIFMFVMTFATLRALVFLT